MRWPTVIAASLGSVAAGAAGVGALLWWKQQSPLGRIDDVTRAIAEGGTIRLRLTGYWPFAAKTEAEKKMEGAPVDRKGRALHTVEDYFAGDSDYVSLSGDSAAWPYGQKLILPWDGGRQLVGRVVDTGQHFRGADKVYRETGAEPIDVCVFSRATKVDRTVTAQIIKGDHFDKPSAKIATELFRGQSVVVGDLEMLGAEAA